MMEKASRCVEKKGGGVYPPPAELWQLIVILAAGVFGLLQFDNPGVGLIGDLGENQQVVAAEALRRFPLSSGVAVAFREGDVAAGALASLVSPNRGLRKLLDLVGRGVG